MITDLPTYADARPLWDAYHSGRSITARNRLIEVYLDLVRIVASNMRRRLPHCIELDEAISAGHFGLIEAVEKYDPSKGTTFNSFATHQIRYSIVVYLREVDHLGRYTRERVTAVGKLQSAMTGELGRKPHPTELAARAGLPLEYTLEALALGNEHESADLTDVMGSAIDRKATDPIEIASRNELVAKIISDLTPIQALYITHRILMEESLIELTRLARRSVPRVSRIVRVAVNELRKRYELAGVAA